MVKEYVRKKKLFAALALIFIAALISGVAAWLSDDQTNTVEIETATVSISLRESNWRPENASDVHPADVLPKNPTITNTGTSDAYVFIEVSMSALKTGAQIQDEKALMELRGPMPLYTTRSRKGEFDQDNWQRLVGPLYDRQKNSISWIYSYSKSNLLTPLAPQASTSALFDAVQLANLVRRDDVEGMDANIYVHAYAIQTTQLGTGGNANSPDTVWTIVSNAYGVKLNAETLPATTPRILKLLPTVKPTATPKATTSPDEKAFYRDARGASGKGVQDKDFDNILKKEKDDPFADDGDDEEVNQIFDDDAALRELFGDDSGSKTKKKRAVG